MLRTRLGAEASIELVEFGEPRDINGVRVIAASRRGTSSARRRCGVEHRGEVWVVSGDYKTEPDPTCTPFEPVRCHTFITESHLRPADLPVGAAAKRRSPTCARGGAANRGAGPRVAPVRLRARQGAAPARRACSARTSGPIYTHGAVERLNADYRASGVALHATTHAVAVPPKGTSFAGSLIVAPPSAAGSTWLRRFGDVVHGVRVGMDARARRAPAPRARSRLRALGSCGLAGAARSDRRRRARERVWVTHGYREPVVRWLTRARHRGARSIASQWEGENDEDLAVADEAATREGDRVKRFARLYRAIDATTRTNEKVAAMVEYFREPSRPTRRGRSTSSPAAGRSG